ncbi:unnamed protein product [Dracunculus medinensis]|uniref:LINE-1 retrotransposable element ORF2 protein n=1 Tax=Dracunculus medinensis TaxID=318479 RepID=A0A0N4UN10_DRAME|nr:unnamed protein product [Dracunculus medinensis]
MICSRVTITAQKSRESREKTLCTRGEMPYQHGTLECLWTSQVTRSLYHILSEHRVHVACLSEIYLPRYGSHAKLAPSRYWLHHCGVSDNLKRNGVTIAISEKIRSALIEWKTISLSKNSMVIIGVDRNERVGHDATQINSVIDKSGLWSDAPMESAFFALPNNMGFLLLMHASGRLVIWNSSDN